MRNALLAAALFAHAAAPAAAQEVLQTETRPAEAPAARPASVPVEEVELSGEVRAVDPARRLVTLEDGSGRRVKVRLPADARGLDELEPGARLSLRYVPPVALAVTRPGAAAAVTDADEVRLEPRGGPALRAKVKRISAELTEVDRSRREITARVPEGHHVVMRLTEDFEGWDALEEGGRVDIHFTDAIARRLDGLGARRAGPGSERFEGALPRDPDRTDADTRLPGSDPLAAPADGRVLAPAEPPAPAR